MVKKRDILGEVIKMLLFAFIDNGEPFYNVIQKGFESIVPIMNPYGFK